MENLEINLKIKVSDAQVILNGLGKLPLETSVNVWMLIKNQAEVQIAAANQAITMSSIDNAEKNME